MSEKELSIIGRAVKILRLLIDSKSAGIDQMVVAEIIKNIGITEDEFWAADDFLTQQGYVKATMGGTSGYRWITGNGIEYHESKVNPTQHVQVGALFQGPVEGSQIQAFASAVNSNIHQVVQNAGPGEVRDTIAKIVDQIVSSVRAELTLDELAAYSKTAKDFKEVCSKDRPDKATVRGLLSRLSFFADVDGTIGLAERALWLAEKIAPYLPVLISYLNKL